MSARHVRGPSKQRQGEKQSDQESPRLKVRRFRAKFTCIECKRRKIRCDRSYPCSACATRGLADSCEYEDPNGPTPQTSPPSLPNIITTPSERLINSGTTGAHSRSFPSSSVRVATTTSSSPTDPAKRRVAIQEKAFSGLEDLVIPNEQQPQEEIGKESKEPPSTGATGEKFWPDILSTFTAKRTAKWNRDMLQVLETLPDKTRLNSMLDFYFAEVQILRLHVHEKVFRDEVVQFETLRTMGMHLSIDPAWLAQLAAILWVSGHFLSDEPNTCTARARVGLTDSALAESCEALFGTMETALTCADWLFRPQFRVLQTVLLVATLDNNRQGPYYRGDLVRGRPEWTRCMYFDVAVGICKGLMLHMDLDVHCLGKLNDPALPVDRPTYSFEVARRAFYTVLFVDTFTRTVGPQTPPDQLSYCFPNASTTTVEPANYSEEALLYPTTARPRDPWEKTPFIWEFHMNRIVGFWRTILALLRAEDTSYGSVLEISQELRASHQDFITMSATHVLRAAELEAFFLINSSYLQRLLRLHRPYLLRSYREPTYAQSRTLALLAAKQNLRAHCKQLNGDDSGLIFRNATYVYIHLVSSTLVLFIHALFDTDSRVEILEEMGQLLAPLRQVCLTGHPSHVGSAAKSYCLVTEMINVINNPPTDVYNMEAIVRNIHTAAEANQAALLDDLSIPIPSNSKPVERYISDLWSFGLDAEAATFTGWMLPEDWNTDWGLFVRDL